MRTNTDQSIPQRLRNTTRPESPSHDTIARPSTDAAGKHALTPVDLAKDKKKGPSFLSRLNIRTRKKDAGDMDSDSEFGGGEVRIDGNTAPVFSQGVYNSGGYIPHHKEPPRYIRTKTHNKKTREFHRMFLAQELVGTRQPGDIPPANPDDKTPAVIVSGPETGDKPDLKGSGAIWATQFSQDGRYFAAGGRDRIVRVWAVISTPEERAAHEEQEAAAHGGSVERLSAPVFRKRPVMEFEGHAGEVLDLSWSKNNFLLSSSMDKTVRLWHVSRKECLCTFKHKDLVTKLAFHPQDDRFFLAGSLDTMLRLWSIPDKSIAYTAQLPAFVTAVAFSPDGKTAIAGLVNGLCLFYDTDGLKYQTQIHVRSSRGKNAKGSKITGIHTMVVPSSSPSPTQLSLPASPRSGVFPASSRTSSELPVAGEVKVLITSNDSRIRVYNLRDKLLDFKLKGHDSSCSQISASFSDDAKYIICGSEDCRAYIWSTSTADSLSDNKDKRAYEYFDAHGTMVTTAKFAPTKTRQLLSQSEDPIYDLCNPPPVKLMSLEEAAAAASTNASQLALGSEYDRQPGTPNIAEAVRRAQALTKKSDSYLTRSGHKDGNILVTTDDNGIIKVFRQDCAFAKRRHENWETGSTFSRKLGTNRGGFGLGRTGSILSKTTASSTAHSRRGSLSHSHGTVPSSIGSPQLAGIAPGASSDRILSWRQDIEHGDNKRASSILSAGTPARSERSLSPSKAGRSPLATSAANLASEARKQPYAGSQAAKRASMRAASIPRKSSEVTPTRASRDKGRSEQEKEKNKEESAPEMPPAPSFTYKATDAEDDPLRLDSAGASYSFWNLNRWKGIAGGIRGSISGPSQGTAGHARSASEASPLGKTRLSTGPGQEAKNKAAGERESRPRKSMGALTATKTPDDQAKMTSPASDAPRLSNSDSASKVPMIKVADGQAEADRRGSADHPTSPYPSSRGESVVSKLSSELETGSVPDHEDSEQDEKRCQKCGGTDFKIKKVSTLSVFSSSRQVESCTRCGQVWEW
ncbi:WD40 repeat-like protein [Thozetella sp. PMI_491]|nr:WD40 repeat-like protein [Thozetella sp. PMI_491]